MLSKKKTLEVVVRGDSMLPALKNGNVVKIEFNNNYSKGDIILYITNEQPVIHRICDVICTDNHIFYRTKGDNSEVFDPLVPEFMVIGKVSI